MNIDGNSANEIFKKSFDTVMSVGETSCPRNSLIKELRNVTLTLKNPLNNVVSVKNRNINKKYLVYEFIWYLMAEQDKTASDMICSHAKFWDTLRNPDGSLNSNYGHYFFAPMDEVLPTEEEYKPISDYYAIHSQYEWIIDTLSKDKDSRQAVVNINNIYHKAHPTKDFPCTTAMQFMIRDNKLHLTVTMRSTDLVLGYCNDVFQFTMFQEMVYNELQNVYPELEIGEYTLFTTSLHIYERHFSMMDNYECDIENEERNNKLSEYSDFSLYDGMRLIDFYYCEIVKPKECFGNYTLCDLCSVISDER